MKTILCDICGKTKDEILIFRYKREGLWCSLWNNDLPKFDICRDCLDTVKKLRDEAGEENETD